MRLAILSDVHGNLPALEAVLEDLEKHAVDGIIVAGDLAGGGPQPIEVMRCLRSQCAWMIRGNADIAVLKYASGEAPAGWHTSRVFSLVRWTHSHLDPETLAFIRSLPEQRAVTLPGAAGIRVVHGSPRNPSESLFPDRDPAVLELALTQVSEPVLVCGHTHIPWQLVRDGKLVLNPGAVNGPLNGEIGAQYAVLSWHAGHWQARHFTVPYDLERLRKAYQVSGFLEDVGPIARAFLHSLQTGQDVAGDFFSYAKKMAPGSDIVPDSIWEQAAVTFDWDRYK